MKVFKKPIALLMVACMFFSVMTYMPLLAQKAGLIVQNLKTEYLKDPLGIDSKSPKFNWQLDSDVRGVLQTAYEVTVYKTAPSGEVVWNSGKVVSNECMNIKYAGKALEPSTRYYWSVKAWDNYGNSAVSEEAFFETGLMDSGWSNAKWIEGSMTRKASEGDVLHYKIETDMTITRDNAGIIFSFKDSGNLYLWSFVTSLANPLLRRHQYVNGSAAVQDVNLTGMFSKADLLNKQHHITIEVNSGIIKTWIDDTLIDTYTDTSGNLVDGYIGLRTYGAERAYFDNFVVTSYINDVPTITFDANFEDGKNPFFGGTIVNVGGNNKLDVGNVGGENRVLNVQLNDALPIFRKDFSLNKPIKQARMYVSGLGVYEVHINGKNISENVLEPIESEFNKKIFYSTYDVTGLLTEGDNAIGAMIGNGIYNVPATPGRYQKLVETKGTPKLIANLTITYEDGQTETIVTDQSWLTTSGPITFSGWYGGEDFDARLVKENWDKPGCDTSFGWFNAGLARVPAGKLQARITNPIGISEVLKAVKVTKISDSVYVFDMGRNFAGWPEITISGEAGTKITMWPSEHLNANGTVNQGSTGSPIWDSYTLKGDGVEVWHPQFVYHGFRYLEVRGLTTPPTTDMIKGYVLRNLNEKIGSLDTSSEVINQIHTIINRSVESNMYSVLTDCPHREKLGWLEVSHLMYDSMAYNYDIAAWMGKISADMTDAQTADGLVPDIAPEYTVFGGGFRDDPTWGGAVVFDPLYSYQTYGDTDVLARAYPTMVKYMDYLKTKENNYLLNHGLGDWGAYDGSTPLGLVVSSTYYSLAKAMEQISSILDKPAEAADYAGLAENIKAAFNKQYFNENTLKYGSGSQSSYAAALFAGLVPDEYFDIILDQLVGAVEVRTNHLSTGEVGLKFMFDALAKNGRSDVVYKMASNKTMPSYWYFIENGATSLPEFWDMNASQNHAMMGHIENWFFESLAGIQNGGIAYKDIVIDPYIPSDLEYVNATTMTMFGNVTSSWTRNAEGIVTLDIAIPANTTAKVRLPYAKNFVVLEGGVPADTAENVKFIGVQGEKAVYEVGSGKYSFTAKIVDPVFYNVKFTTNAKGAVLKINGKTANLPYEITFKEDSVINAELITYYNEDIFAAWEGIPEGAVIDKNKISFTVNGNVDVNAKTISISRENLAYKKAVTVSSQLNYPPTWTASNITDGYRKNSTAGGIGYTTDVLTKTLSTPHNITINLGSVQEFSRVIMFPRGDGAATATGGVPNFPSTFEIQVSNNGTNFTTVKKVSGHSPKGFEGQVFDFDKVSAQYIRISITVLGEIAMGEGVANAYRIQLAEIEVYNYERFMPYKLYNFAQDGNNISINIASTISDKLKFSGAIAKCALYDDNGALVWYDSIGNIDLGDIDGDVNLSFDIPEQYDSGKIKIFLWDANNVPIAVSYSTDFEI